MEKPELAVEAIELETLLAEMPSSYGFFGGDGEMVWIHPDDPQYEEAKAAYEKRLKRIFR